MTQVTDQSKSISPEESALLEAEERLLSWLRGRGKGEDEQTSGRWIEAFMAGGRAALARELPRENWLYLRIELPSFMAARRVLAKALYPTLTRLTEQGAIKRYWFLVKHDTCFHIRLRVFGSTASLRTRARDEIMRALRPGENHYGVTVCQELVYEPETALFGGDWGIERIHELFYYDSRFAMAWLNSTARSRGGVSSHEVSVTMIQHLLRATGLDAFERWDVWKKLTQVRSGDPDQLKRVYEQNREVLQDLVDVMPTAFLGVLGPKLQESVNAYAADLEEVGERLWEGQRTGKLERGLRHILATSICFNWNRMLFVGDEQVMLAYIVSRATEPIEQAAS